MRRYKAIFFDLDGTLLPMDMNDFLKGYFAALYDFGEEHGFDGKIMIDAVQTGVSAMITGYDASGINSAEAALTMAEGEYLEGGACQSKEDASDSTDAAASRVAAEPKAPLNSDKFWQVFLACLNQKYEELKASAAANDVCEAGAFTRAKLEPLINQFYYQQYTQLGKLVEANPAAAKAIATCAKKGYTLYLTTMPLFPLQGVVERLRWAGIEDASVFSRITTYDNSHYTKPDIRYFQENLDAAGLSGEEVLVVGNNTHEDLIAMQLGCDGYLLTEWLLDPVHYDINQVKHGTLAEFAKWCESLPQCEA